MIRCLVNRHHQHDSVRDLPQTGRPRTQQPQVLKDVMENALKRAHQCEAENGGHLRDIIFPYLV